MEERLQKILAKQGYGSRRFCETIIAEGRVEVNGKLATLGMKADMQRDKIVVDGRQLDKVETDQIYVAVHKPRGVLSDQDEYEKRATVREMVPVPGHLFCVGRLDYDSEGLILMTNDGDLANHLTHPRYRHDKEYRVLVAKKPDSQQLAGWRRGIVMEDGSRTLPARVEVERLTAKGTWLRIILREGKKRQIREVGARIGLPVSRIIRTRISTLELGDLKLGEWRFLTDKEVAELKSASSAKAAPRKAKYPKKRQA
ncbi:MAG: pseudouridine synthase [Anaerolineaceae bacterium]|jgi:23S rRNA pseudouridine2605 synthase|nr:pseudouridine synthase [Anaerolineaceae bacterium]